MAGERAFPAQGVPFLGGRVIASPFQFATSGEEYLRVVSVNSLTGVQIAIQGRRLSDRGEIEPLARVHVPNSNRTVKTDDYPLGVGALMNLAVFASSGSPQHGQTFVIVQIVRGTGAVAVVLGTILQGYVTSTQGLGWPGSPIESSFSGPGCLRQVDFATPAVGAQLSYTVPTGVRWQIDSALFYLYTGAGSAATVRRVSFDVVTSDHSHYLVYLTSTSGIVANKNYTFFWLVDIDGSVEASGYAEFIRLPMIPFVYGGMIVESYSSSFDPSDHYGPSYLSVHEWLSVD